jgi:rubrerythrin
MARRSDVELLETLLAVEARQAAAYEAALRRGAIEPALGEELLEHEREHVAALERRLGAAERNPRASVPSSELTRALRNREEFARYALGLETEAVAAYGEAAANVTDAKLRQPLGSIMACEAAHRVALRNALGRRPLVD